MQEIRGGSIGRMGPSEVPGSREGLRPGGGDGTASFADTLESVMGEVAELNTTAQDTMGAFLRGEPVEIHRVMAAAEEAGLALEMLIEIRNKLTDAYRSVMQMQT